MAEPCVDYSKEQSSPPSHPFHTPFLTRESRPVPLTSHPLAAKVHSLPCELTRARNWLVRQIRASVWYLAACRYALTGPRQTNDSPLAQRCRSARGWVGCYPIQLSLRSVGTWFEVSPAPPAASEPSQRAACDCSLSSDLFLAGQTANRVGRLRGGALDSQIPCCLPPTA